MLHSLKVVIPERAIEASSSQAPVLEFLVRATGAEIVSTELFLKLFITTDFAFPPLDVRFGCETFASLAHGFVERADLRSLVFCS